MPTSKDFRSSGSHRQLFRSYWGPPTWHSRRVNDRVEPASQNPYCRGEGKAVYQAPAPHNTCGSCWLGTAQRFHHEMRGESGSRITSKSKQGAHTPTHGLTLRKRTDLSRGQCQPRTVVLPLVSDRANPSYKTLSCRGESFKSQFHTTHVGAVGWEPYGSSPTTCAGKADHEFGVCVPLALICLLKIVN